jgi:hypothetical protein
VTQTTQSAEARPSTPSRKAAAPPRLRRRPAFAALGAALVAFGGLGAVWLATTLDSSTSVVVAAHAVYRGQTLGEDDLTVASVSGLTGSNVLAADQLASAVGQTAQTDLPAGMPVSSDSLTSSSVPASGHSVVGIKVAPGQMPTVDIYPGDRVRVVGTPRSQDDAPSTVGSGTPATVISTSQDESSGNTVVNVVVPAADAAQVAALAATNRVALVLDSDSAAR